MKGDTNNLNINKKIYFDSEFIKILNNLHKNVEIKKIIFFLINLDKQLDVLNNEIQIEILPEEFLDFIIYCFFSQNIPFLRYLIPILEKLVLKINMFSDFLVEEMVIDNAIKTLNNNMDNEMRDLLLNFILHVLIFTKHSSIEYLKEIMNSLEQNILLNTNLLIYFEKLIRENQIDQDIFMKIYEFLLQYLSIYLTPKYFNLILKIFILSVDNDFLNFSYFVYKNNIISLLYSFFQLTNLNTNILLLRLSFKLMYNDFQLSDEQIQILISRIYNYLSNSTKGEIINLSWMILEILIMKNPNYIKLINIDLFKLSKSTFNSLSKYQIRLSAGKFYLMFLLNCNDLNKEIIQDGYDIFIELKESNSISKSFMDKFEVFYSRYEDILN